MMNVEYAWKIAPRWCFPTAGTPCVLTASMTGTLDNHLSFSVFDRLPESISLWREYQINTYPIMV